MNYEKWPDVIVSNENLGDGVGITQECHFFGLILVSKIFPCVKEQ